MPGTRVELVRADNQKVFFKTSGYDNEKLRHVVVDLQKVNRARPKFSFVSSTRKAAAGATLISTTSKFYADKPSISRRA